MKSFVSDIAVGEVIATLKNDSFFLGFIFLVK
jgi:hypothetical protein